MCLVKLKWQDIMTYGDKKPLGEAMCAQLATCETVGFLIYEDKKQIILAHNIFDIPECPQKFASEYSVIPKGCVIERRDYQ